MSPIVPSTRTIISGNFKYGVMLGWAYVMAVLLGNFWWANIAQKNYLFSFMVSGQLIKKFNWGPSQPTGDDQHCMYIVGGYLGYQWADFHCGFEMTFLCEHDVNGGNEAWRRRREMKKVISRYLQFFWEIATHIGVSREKNQNAKNLTDFHFMAHRRTTTCQKGRMKTRQRWGR